MASLRSLCFVLLVLCGCSRISGCSPFGRDWAIERIEERWNSSDPKEDLIRFKNGTTWENLGMKAEKMADIPGAGNTRAIAFKALSCVECEPDLLLTIRSTGDEQVISESYPGKTTALDSVTGVVEHEPFAEVRAYFGKCVEGKTAEVFLIDTFLREENRATRRTIEATEHGLDSARADVDPTLIRGFKTPSGCQELPGVDREIEQ